MTIRNNPKGDYVDDCCQCGVEVLVYPADIPDVIISDEPAWCSSCRFKAPCKHCGRLYKLHQPVASRKSNVVCKGYKDWFSPALDTNPQQ